MVDVCLNIFDIRFCNTLLKIEFSMEGSLEGAPECIPTFCTKIEKQFLRRWSCDIVLLELSSDVLPDDSPVLLREGLQHCRRIGKAHSNSFFQFLCALSLDTCDMAIFPSFDGFEEVFAIFGAWMLDDKKP